MLIPSRRKHDVAALIFKICDRAEWNVAIALGAYRGSAKDRQDGFLHFSTQEQLPGTLQRYYAGAKDLLLVAVDANILGDALRFERSRDGALFPHLYCHLSLASVMWAKPIGRGTRGEFLLPF
jgi:uncharacterized protein (DUF952 family)